MNTTRDWQVRVIFYTDIAAATKEEVDEQIHNLLYELGQTKTTLDWDDCEWDAVWCGPELEVK